MSKLTVITDRALERIFDFATQTSQNIRHLSVGLAPKPISNGLWRRSRSNALSAAKLGKQSVITLTKRHPALVVTATVASLGLLGYAMYRKRKQSQARLLEDVIEHSIDEDLSSVGGRLRRGTAHYATRRGLIHDR